MASTGSFQHAFSSTQCGKETAGLTGSGVAAIESTTSSCEYNIPEVTAAMQNTTAGYTIAMWAKVDDTSASKAVRVFSGDFSWKDAAFLNNGYKRWTFFVARSIPPSSTSSSNWDQKTATFFTPTPGAMTTEVAALTTCNIPYAENNYYSLAKDGGVRVGKFVGAIDTVWIFHHALTDDQVLGLVDRDCTGDTRSISGANHLNFRGPVGVDMEFVKEKVACYGGGSKIATEAVTPQPTPSPTPQPTPEPEPASESKSAFPTWIMYALCPCIIIAALIKRQCMRRGAAQKANTAATASPTPTTQTYPPASTYQPYQPPPAAAPVQPAAAAPYGQPVQPAAGTIPYGPPVSPQRHHSSQALSDDGLEEEMLASPSYRV